MMSRRIRATLLAARPRAVPTALASALLLAGLIVFAPPASQAAPGELAAIAVSLTVQETCLVQSTDAVINLANQPVVSCLHGTPFQITQTGYDPSTSPSSATSVALSADTSRTSAQPVQFLASHDVQQTVWMVNF